VAPTTAPPAVSSTPPTLPSGVSCHGIAGAGRLVREPPRNSRWQRSMGAGCAAAVLRNERHDWAGLLTHASTFDVGVPKRFAFSF